MLHSLRLRVALLVVVSMALLGTFWVVCGPLPQPAAYHNFADQRPMLSLPHALNVLSNLPFVVFGVIGIAFLLKTCAGDGQAIINSSERMAYWVFFVGLVLTGIGSSYYHANPTNDTLSWDRAGLAITFMALFTTILAERVHVGCARWLLWPLVLFGIVSVFYWDYTEGLGSGDLRLYFIAQFYPLAILPVLLCFYPPRYTHAGGLLASLLCYGLAKGLEILDRQVYGGVGFVSGHTLKHLVASLSAGFILLMLWQRRLRVTTR